MEREPEEEGGAEEAICKTGCLFSTNVIHPHFPWWPPIRGTLAGPHNSARCSCAVGSALRNAAATLGWKRRVLHSTLRNTFYCQSEKMGPNPTFAADFMQDTEAERSGSAFAAEQLQEASRVSVWGCKLAGSRAAFPRGLRAVCRRCDTSVSKQSR